MRTAVCGLVCVLTLALAASRVSAANLITNPGYESGTLPPWTELYNYPDGYAVGTCCLITVESADNGPSAAGTRNVNLYVQYETVGGHRARTFLYQKTANGTAVPGTVNYSFDLRDANPVSGGELRASIFSRNSADLDIGSPVGLGPFSRPHASGWTTISGSFVAPAGTDHLVIQFEAYADIPAAVAFMHVDNVSLEQPVPVEVSGFTIE